MPVNRVLAAVAVADVDSARGWYERLLGRSADALPMDHPRRAALEKQ